jgi:hypothetical protein
MLSAEQLARYARHVVVPEIGAAGQARLMVAIAPVGTGDRLEERVAARYAQRAGFAGVSAARIVVAELAPRAIVANDACRRVLAGARTALGALRQAVGAEP